MNKYIEIKNKTDDTAEVWIYDEIGENFWGEGITAKGFVSDLNKLDVKNIDLHINSPGGNVWDGQAIFNAVQRHPAKVTTYIDGLAASIASTIALAGDEVIMADNSLMMIHNAWNGSMGNAKEHRATADLLDKVDDTLTGIYVNKTGKKESEIQSAMEDETWFTASEAVEFGLADSTSEGLDVAAKLNDWDMVAKFKNVPEGGDGSAHRQKPMTIAEQFTAQFYKIDYQDTTSGADVEVIVNNDEDGASEVEETPVNKEYELLKMKKGI